MKGVHKPFEEFKRQITSNEETMRIKKAMAPSQLDTVASQIAAVVAAERPQSRLQS